MTITDFADVVAAHVDAADTVERTWLLEAVESAAGAGDDVLVVAKPGAGKTGLAAALAHRNPRWLRYFVRKDSRTRLSGGDVQSFLLKIGHQFAAQRPELFDPGLLEVVVRQRIDQVGDSATVTGIQVDDLVVSPFYRTALQVDQWANRVDGQLRGIAVGHAMVEPRLLQPDNLAMLALGDPAAVLASRAPRERIVVVVDALDELFGYRGSEGLLDWLTHRPELPSNVSFVMTSRPGRELRSLTAGRGGRRPREITISPASGDVRDDIGKYVTALARKPAAADVIAGRDGGVARFRTSLVARADGNFSYVVSYSRALLAAMEGDDMEAVERLLSYEELPHGLDEMYGFFLDLVRSGVERLGVLTVRTPLSPEDRAVPAWEGVGRPMLAVLAVAFEAVSREQVIRLGGIRVWPDECRPVFERFTPFLDIENGAMRLFHSSLGEFLVKPATREPYPDLAVDPAEWHARIVRSYLDGTGAGSLSDPDWDAMDRYGLAHLPEHVMAGEADAGPDGEVVRLADFVTPRYRRALLREFHGDERFNAVLLLVSDDVVYRPYDERTVPDVVFLGLVRRGLHELGANVPPLALGLLVRLGRTDEALQRLSLLDSTTARFQCLQQIRRFASPEEIRRLESQIGLEALVDCALAVPGRGLPERSTRDETVLSAAEELAAVDLDRALGLAELIGHETRMPGRPSVTPRLRNRVLRAAAACAEPDRAVELIDLMSEERTVALLDVAERVADPAGRSRVLSLVEAALDAIPGEEPQGWRLRERWVSEARLAVLLHATDPERAATRVARLHAGLAQERTEWAAEEFPDIGHWVRAAEKLRDIAPRDAERILDGACTVPASSSTNDTLATAAGLWARWGEPERSWQAAERALHYYRGLGWFGPAGDIARLALHVLPADAAYSRQLLDEALGMVPPPDSDIYHSDPHIDSVVAKLAETLFDLGRTDEAVEMARELPRTGPVPGSQPDWANDRDSLLARFARGLLETSPQRAEELLSECLRWPKMPVPTDGYADAAPNPLFHRETEAPEPSVDPSPHTLIEAGADLWNLLQSYRVARLVRFFWHPCDIARAALPPPGFYGSPQSWDLLVRTAVETLAETDPALARQILDRVTDPVESAIGLAALTARALATGDPEADALRRKLDASLAALSPYTAMIDVDRMDPLGVSRLLDPSVRARFECAVRLHPVDPEGAMALVEGTGARYLPQVIAAAILWREAEEMAAMPDPRLRLLRFRVERYAATLPAKLAQGDPPVVSVVLMHSAQVLAGIGVAVPTEPIPEPAYRAMAQVLSSPDVATAVGVLDRLPDSVLPHHSALITAVVAGGALVVENSGTARVLYGTDAAGLTQRALALARSIQDPALRARGLIAVLAQPGLTPFLDLPETLTQIRSAVEAVVFPEHYDELLRELFVVTLMYETDRAGEALLANVRQNWHSAMGALTESIDILLDQFGVGVLDAIHQRALDAQECLTDPFDHTERPGGTDSG
ncbi:hypothetical protein AR457_40480 [Streptomyces agglomeratus]|uniref:hypothetical protein n=1 Tax=Streptomyces agglomeratus TaxID=285458 RepID=UPI00085268D5|nr:hypothetical protein [Streptomyces agglomeratus]OEJ22154.1 hypothetical protein AR457_40480 [Streptomyces agglomeratus]OEJ36992.1 hypothetical protein BGK70_01135 [Streptomyces agglomeratus]